MSVYRSRSWVMTLWTVPDVDCLKALPGVRYWCVGREVCPETKTIHYHAFVYLKQPKSWNAFTDWWHGQRRFQETEHKDVHIEECQNIKKYIKYCQKDSLTSSKNYHPDNWFLEEGLKPRQGKRTDIINLMDAVHGGVSDLDLYLFHTGAMVKYNKAVTKFRYLLDRRNAISEPVECTLFWGPTGVGKTRLVWEKEQSLYVYSGDSGSNIWFDGYSGESAILFDDFNGDIRLSTLLRLTDRYPIRLPVKGDFVMRKCKSIYFTSNLPIEDWYPSANPEHLSALKRRFTLIRKM